MGLLDGGIEEDYGAVRECQRSSACMSAASSLVSGVGLRPLLALDGKVWVLK